MTLYEFNILELNDSLDKYAEKDLIILLIICLSVI